MGPNDMDHVSEPNCVPLTLYNIILLTNVKEEL